MVVDYRVRFQGYCCHIAWINKVYQRPVIHYGFVDFNKLPERYIDFICLHFVYKMSFREIGEIYGCSRSNVQRVLYDAYRKLNRGDYS